MPSTIASLRFTGRSTTCTNGVILSITGAPAASDSLRLVSAAFWVAAALVAFLLAYRATGSLVLAAGVHLLAFRALGFIGEETAHPQEACVLLLLALCRAFYIANPRLRHDHDGSARRRHGGNQNQSRDFRRGGAHRGPDLRTAARMAAQRSLYRRLPRRTRAAGGPDVGPPHGVLGHLLLRTDRLLACLHPAHRVGPAVERAATACAMPRWSQAYSWGPRPPSAAFR